MNIPDLANTSTIKYTYNSLYSMNVLFAFHIWTLSMKVSITDDKTNFHKFSDWNRHCHIDSAWKMH